MERAEDAQENLLRQVERLFAVPQEVGREAEHEPVVLENERGMGHVIACQAAFDERSFAAGDLRPTDCFARLSGEISCHVGTPPEYSRFLLTWDPGTHGMFREGAEELALYPSTLVPYSLTS